jgi:hypothetical protein
MKLWLVVLAVLLVFVSVKADDYFTSCIGNVCTYSSTPQYFADKTQLAVKDGVLTWSGNFPVTIEPFIVHSGTTYDVKSFSFLTDQGATISFDVSNMKNAWKWVLNINKIPTTAKSGFQQVGFNLKYDGKGYADNKTKAIVINGVKFSFQDLIDAGFDVDVKDATQVIITGVSGKSDLNLDPTIILNTASGLIEDNYVSLGNPTTVYVVGNTIRGESYNFVDKDCRLFFWFNTSSIPAGATITNATLTLNLSSYTTAGTRTYNVYSVNEYDFTSLTWNNQPAANIMVGNGSIIATARTLSELNLTYNFADVYYQNNVTFLMVRDSSETSATEYSRLFYSRNDTGIGIPKLIVSYTTNPNTNPQWSANATSQSYPITYGASNNGFQVQWFDGQDANGYNVSLIEHNITGTLANYTTTRTGNVSYYNYTSPAANCFTVKFYANDSSNAWNTTNQWTYCVNQASRTASLTFGNGGVGQYPFSDTPTCSYTGSSTDGTASLTRNGTTQTSGASFPFPAGGFNMTCLIATGQNYTSATVTKYLNVTKGDTLCSLYLNGTQADKTYSNPSGINVTLLINATQNTNSLHIASNYTGWVIQTGNAPSISNTSVRLTADGKWNFTGYYDATENYTSCTRTYYATVSSNTVPNWFNNLTTPASPRQYKQATINFQVSCSDSDGSCNGANVTFNGTIYKMTNTTPNIYYYNFTNPYGAGTYTYTYTVWDNSLGSNTSQSFYYVISQATHNISMSSANVTFPNMLSWNCAGNETGATSLYLNNSLQSLAFLFSGVGNYNLTCLAAATENFSATSTSAWLVVSQNGTWGSGGLASDQNTTLYNLPSLNSIDSRLNSSHGVNSWNDSGTTAQLVWNYAQKNLTDYNQTEIISKLTSLQSNQTSYFPYWNDSYFKIWNQTFFYWNSTGITYFGIDTDAYIFSSGTLHINITAYLETGASAEATFQCYVSNGTTVAVKTWNKQLTSTPYSEVITLTVPKMSPGMYAAKCDLYLFKIFSQSASAGFEVRQSSGFSSVDNLIAKLQELGAYKFVEKNKLGIPFLLTFATISLAVALWFGREREKKENHEDNAIDSTKHSFDQFMKRFKD